MKISNCKEKQYELYSRYEESGRDDNMSFGDYVEWLSIMQGVDFWAWLYDAPFLTAVPLSYSQVPQEWKDELAEFIKEYC